MKPRQIAVCTRKHRRKKRSSSRSAWFVAVHGRPSPPLYHRAIDDRSVCARYTSPAFRSDTVPQQPQFCVLRAHEVDGNCPHRIFAYRRVPGGRCAKECPDNRLHRSNTPAGLVQGFCFWYRCTRLRITPLAIMTAASRGYLLHLDCGRLWPLSVPRQPDNSSDDWNTFASFPSAESTPLDARRSTLASFALVGGPGWAVGWWAPNRRRETKWR